MRSRLSTPGNDEIVAQSSTVTFRREAATLPIAAFTSAHTLSASEMSSASVRAASIGVVVAGGCSPESPPPQPTKARLKPRINPEKATIFRLRTTEITVENYHRGRSGRTG